METLLYWRGVVAFQYWMSFEQRWMKCGALPRVIGASGVRVGGMRRACGLNDLCLPGGGASARLRAGNEAGRGAKPLPLCRGFFGVERRGMRAMSWLDRSLLCNGYSGELDAGPWTLRTTVPGLKWRPALTFTEISQTRWCESEFVTDEEGGGYQAAAGRGVVPTRRCEPK